MGWAITSVAIALVAFAALSGRLHGTAVTPAIVFTGAGFVLGTKGFDLLGSELDTGTVRLLAEVTLTLVLFSDASALRPRVLRRETGVPARMLGIGLPLTIVLGTLFAIGMFPKLGLFEALVLAVLLAPTDAALGQTVVADQRLPSRLRQGLNVESGLNDGVCVPLLFAAVAFAELEEAPTFEGEILIDLVREVGIAVAVGAFAAAAVALVLTWSNRRGWLEAQWGQVVPLATAAIAYSATVEFGGSGFIAAFVAGLVYRQRVGAETAHETTRLTEEVGGLMSAATFFAFGAILIGSGITDLDVATVAVCRPQSHGGEDGAGRDLVDRGRRGTAHDGVRRMVRPAGLATIVFMLTIVEESNLIGTPRIVQVATATVLLSVVAHGVTAPWLTDRYVQWFSTSRERLALESQDAADMIGPARRSLWHRAAPER